MTYILVIDSRKSAEKSCLCKIKDEADYYHTGSGCARKYLAWKNNSATCQFCDNTFEIIRKNPCSCSRKRITEETLGLFYHTLQSSPSFTAKRILDNVFLVKNHLGQFRVTIERD